MYSKPDGSIVLVEVKSGNAVPSKRQSEIFPKIEDGSAILLKSSADLLKKVRKYSHVELGMSLNEVGLSKFTLLAAQDYSHAKERSLLSVRTAGLGVR